MKPRLRPVFLTLDEVLALHADQLERYGGDPGLRDVGLLESALATPRATFGRAYRAAPVGAAAAARGGYLARPICFMNSPLSQNRYSSNMRARRQELARLEPGASERNGFVVRSQAMARVLDLAQRVARVESTALVTGESGVGKERIARLIHEQSARAARQFVAVNCGAVTETLLESELFGHARGAFTGADRERPGLFEAASGGTLFLDEVGEVSPGMQVKLLRALQEKEVRRVGETRSRAVDVRVVAATNRNLADEVSAGRFRQDLYYRLRVIELRVPPLRDRPEDVLPLARVFLVETAKRMGRKVTGFTPRVADQLARYEWPGNVREVQNAVEHAVALCSGSRIDVEDLPEELRTAMPRPRPVGRTRPLTEVEREYILAAVESAGGNRTRAAGELGIGLATLKRKLKQYGGVARERTR